MARDVLFNIIIIYLIVINIITFIVFAIDKHLAKMGSRRIREITLLELSLVGGSLGGLIAMYAVRHKTKKLKFVITVPVMLIAQVTLLVYLFIKFY